MSSNGEDAIVEVYRGDRGYPTHYRCPKCGSEFPVIGDTDQWRHCETYEGPVSDVGSEED